MKSPHCFNHCLLMLSIAITLNACANQPVIIEPLHQSQFCNNISRSLTLGGIELIDQEKLLTVMGQQSALNDAPRAKGHALLITQGLQSSAGYGVLLNSRQALVEQTTLTLPVSFQRPPSNTVTASVMTTPCLVLDVPKGSYTAVQAGDYFLQLP